MTDCLLWFAILAVMVWHDCKRWGYSLRAALVVNLIILLALALVVRGLIKLHE